MLHLYKMVILASALAMPLAAAADTIDVFSFTSSSHTISYSLPSSITFRDMPPPVIDMFTESAPTTIDGVSGYSVRGAYYLRPGYEGYNLILEVPSSIFGSSPLEFNGPWFFTYTLQGSFITANFVPGTYDLNSFSYSSGATQYTLTITQEDADTPEPKSLVLLATGIVGLIGVAEIRRRRLRNPA